MIAAIISHRTAAKMATIPTHFALHHLCLGTLGTEDIRSIGDESLSNKGLLTSRTTEALWMPASILKGDKLGS